MVEIDSHDHEAYESWFTDRMVSVNKHGVPDVKEEVEEIEMDIDKVPWKELGSEERVAVAKVALNSIKTIFDHAVYDDQIEESKSHEITTHFATMLFNKITLTEDPFEGMGFGLFDSDIDDLQ